MNPTPPQDVPIPIHVDSSEVDDLHRKLVDADTQVQQLQANVLKLVAALSGVSFTSVAHAQSALAPSGGIAGLSGIDSKLDAAITALSARINTLVQQGARPAPGQGAPPPQPASAPQPSPIPGPVPQAGGNPAQQTQLNTLFIQWLQQQVAPGQRQAQAPGTAPGAPPSGAQGGTSPGWMYGTAANQAATGGNWNQMMANLALQTGILNTIMPYATGGQAPAQMNGSQATQAAVAAQSRGGGGGRVSAAGIGFLSSSLQIATQGDTETGLVNMGADMLKGIASKFVTVLGAIAPEVAVLAGAGAGLGAAGLAFNALGATAITREQSLLANVGGAASGVPETGTGLGNATGTGPGMSGGLLRSLYGIGQRYQTSPATSAALASQIGGMGTPGGQVPQDLALALAFSRITGESQQTSAALTGSFAVSGSQAPGQIDRIFQVIQLSAEKAGIPMNKLVDSIQQLEQSTGGAARSVYDVAGAIATQKILGVGMATGTIAAPAQNAIGMAAVANANLLGVPLGQFQAAQGNQAKLMDMLATRAQGMFGGGGRVMNPSAGQIAYVQQLAQAAGFDLSGLNAEQAGEFSRKVLSAQPGSFQALARQYAGLAGPSGAFAAQGVAVANAETSQVQQKLIAAENELAQHAITLADDFSSISGVIHTILSGPAAIGNYLDTHGTISYGAIGQFFAPFKDVPTKGLPTTPAGWDAYAAANPNAPRQNWNLDQRSAYVAAQANLGILPDSGQSLSVAGHPLSQAMARQYYMAAYHAGVNPLLLMGQGAIATGGKFNATPQEIAAQASQMQHLLQHYGGNATEALAAYNPGTGPGKGAAYAQSVEADAGKIQIDLTVGGKLYVTDLTNAQIGIGTITPQKTTIDYTRQPVGHRPQYHPPTKKKKL